MYVFLAYYNHNEIQIRADNAHQARRKAIKHFKPAVARMYKVVVYAVNSSGCVI